MSRLKKNITANFAGSLWTTIMGLLFVPIYIHFLGIESYGLVGVFATIMATFSILDMGIGDTLNREMARLAMHPDKSQDMRDFVKTFEIIYWAVAAIIGCIMVIFAPFIAADWVQVEQLQILSVEQSIFIMGIVMVFQWPIGYYTSGMMGLQNQVTVNIITTIMATLRGVGAIIILWLISPTIQAFFIWQGIISAIQTLWMALILWHSLPHTAVKARFQISILRGIWSFAAGVSGITVLGLVLSQIDKIILSKFLTLEMFGYYTLASTVALSFRRLLTPIYVAVFPQLSQLSVLQDHDSLRQLYHKSCQLVSIMILPFTMVVAFFSYEILFLWTRSATTAYQSYILVRILIIGTCLNGLMYLPYGLQLANGWTKLSLYTNLLAVVILVPLIIILAKHYGAVGAASVWIILNTAYLLAVINLMHRHLLPAEKWEWYLFDIGIPSIVALLIVGMGRVVVPNNASQLVMAFGISIISVMAFFTTALATPYGRNLIMSYIIKLQPIKIK